MKNRALKRGIFQGFIFSIIILICLFLVGVNYLFPEYNKIEKQKNELKQLQDKYSKLKFEGLSYREFKKNNTRYKELNIDTLNKPRFQNILKEFKEVDYNSNFINRNKKISYKTFISKKRIKVQEEKNRLENLGVGNNIDKILPEYTEDSSLNIENNNKINTKIPLTDFKFINYIEKLLNNFNLKSSNNIGIRNLKVEDSVEFQIGKKNENQLEGKIYNFTLNLDLEGKKKNIINFIHYLENVGNINKTGEGDIEIKKLEKRKGNNFGEMSRYFLGNRDIYNNLIVDIEKISFENYLDSSKLPTHYDNGETFIGFIKKDTNQINEKISIHLTLKFYVKGLPIYQIKEYINKVILRHRQITGAILTGIKEGERNKKELTYLIKSSIKKLKEYSLYLQSIDKDIRKLRQNKKGQSKIGRNYKKSQDYNEVFNIIEKGLEKHLKRISKKVYKNYKKIKQGNDIKK